MLFSGGSKKSVPRFWIFIFIAAFYGPAVCPVGAAIQDIIRDRLEAGGIPLKISIAGDPIHAAVVLPRFYERRAYRPAWSKEHQPSDQVAALGRSIRKAAADGLRPADYHLDKITAILEDLDGKNAGLGAMYDQRLADLDILLTDAYLVLGAHMLAGRIDPERLDPMWKAQRRNMDLAAKLENALQTERIGASLAELLPRHSGYDRLKKTLARYRQIEAARDWQAFPGGAKLLQGDRDRRVALLRERLTAECVRLIVLFG